MYNVAQPAFRRLSRSTLSLVGLFLIGCMPPDTSDVPHTSAPLSPETPSAVPQAFLSTINNQARRTYALNIGTPGI